MPLNRAEFENDFKQLMTDMRTRTEVSDEEYAMRFTTLIDAYIKDALISYTGGLVAPSGGGPVTGTFNHTIS